MRIHPAKLSREGSTDYDGIRRRHHFFKVVTFRPSSTLTRRRVLFSTPVSARLLQRTSILDKFFIFKDFKRVAAEDLTLLDAPILEGRAANNALKDKIVTLERWIKRLSTLKSNDALWLFKNSIAMSKLPYILRTYSYANTSLLQQFDMVPKNGLETMLNVQLADTQLKQASLPVQMSGLGVRSVHTGTFSLSGFCCSHGPPPRNHPVSLSRRSRLHRSIWHEVHVELTGQHDRALRPIQAHLGKRQSQQRPITSWCILLYPGRSNKA